MVSNVSAFKTELKNIIDTISFDSTTLGTAGLVETYKRSVKEVPVTYIDIFRSNLNSNRLESRVNKRSHLITTRIKCYVVDREEQAQEDIDYLTEQIISKYENELSNVQWGNGYLDNSSINSTEKDFEDNFYTVDVTVTINTRVNVLG